MWPIMKQEMGSGNSPIKITENIESIKLKSVLLTNDPF